MPTSWTPCTPEECGSETEFAYFADPIVSVQPQFGGQLCLRQVLSQKAGSTGGIFWGFHCGQGFINRFFGRSGYGLDAMAFSCSESGSTPLQPDNTGGEPWAQDVTSSSGFTRIDVLAQLTGPEPWPVILRLDFFSSSEQVFPSIGPHSGAPTTSLDCAGNGKIIGLHIESIAGLSWVPTPIVSSIRVICANV
jgi:hypothetical protein